jgi:hypothetical protein
MLLIQEVDTRHMENVIDVRVAVASEVFQAIPSALAAVWLPFLIAGMDNARAEGAPVISKIFVLVVVAVAQQSDEHFAAAPTVKAGLVAAEGRLEAPLAVRPAAAVVQHPRVIITVEVPLIVQLR